MTSNLTLMDECDTFPYPHKDPKAYNDLIAGYYAFKVTGCPSVLGHVPNHAVENAPWPSYWTISRDSHTLTLTLADKEDKATDAVEAEKIRSALMAETMDIARKNGYFSVLKGWRDELYAVYGPDGKKLLDVERSASPLLGVVTYGVHMTGYVVDKETGAMSIWVPRRSATKSTYPSMLDNTVGGGITSGEDPFESLVREAMEEASLPEDVVRKHAKSAGRVTYWYIRDARAGGETGLLQPECQWVYDLELPEDVIPKPNDNEAESFELMTLDQVKAAMANGEYKPNCALTIIDFFIRHGILTKENEKDYDEIRERVRRKLEYPMI